MDNTEEALSAAEAVNRPTADSGGGTVSVGKFKSAETLLKAYNSLEAEFTKRSQRLKELEKTLNEPVPNVQAYTEAKDGSTKQPTELAKPFGGRGDWVKRVEEFVNNNPKARAYAADITGEILRGAVSFSDENGLLDAYHRVLARNYTEPEKLTENGEFMEKYVYNNAAVKDKIITEYLDGLKSVNLPKFVGKGGDMTVLPPKKPKSLEEAGRLAERFLK
ncbi:MAG: hypothetical protein LBT30_04125 [Clostridiales bacterium]|jgi:hypothetical protein|nr:hypothetical protein [Clostridiales bacterium]